MAKSGSALGKKWAAGDTDHVAKLMTKAFDNFKPQEIGTHRSSFLQAHREQQEVASQLQVEKKTLENLGGTMKDLLSKINGEVEITAEIRKKTSDELKETEMKMQQATLRFNALQTEDKAKQKALDRWKQLNMCGSSGICLEAVEYVWKYSNMCGSTLLNVLCSLRSAQCALLKVLCSMRSARCALPNALCSMRSAQCALLNALCSMRSAQCALLLHQWVP